MNEWSEPRRFLMVFMQRSGSTFLAHCLDSHPEVGAERGEPLNPGHVWRATFPGEAAEAIMDVVLGRPGYRVTVARANWRHALALGDGYLQGLDGLLFLYRENIVHNMISSHINAAGVKAVHAFHRQPPASVVIDPDDFLRGCRRSDTKRQAALEWLRRLDRPVLVTTYEAITGGKVEARSIPKPEAARLCEFLGVERRTLACSLRRINPERPEDLVTNWAELEAVLRESEYGECLDTW